VGTWDIGVFDNDAAADWAFGLEKTSDASYVEATLDKVLRVGTGYLEGPDADEGLAAAETVARLLGRGGPKTPYTEPVDKWVSAVKVPVSASLARKAMQVASRVLVEPSEALELWQESDDFEKWKSLLNDLSVRLSG
jgi:hypothetical protein